MDGQERQDRLAALDAELDATVHQLWRLTTPSWRIELGRIRIHRQIGSQFIAKLYMLLNVIVAVGGALLILFSAGRAADLGIALVVGALFSMGAFIAAVWVLTVEGERHMHEQVFGTERQQQIARLRERADEIWEEIQALRSDENDTGE